MNKYENYYLNKRLQAKHKLNKSKRPSVYAKRRFIDKALRRLFEESYEILSPLECTAYVTKEPLPFDKKTEGIKKELKIGDRWAEEDFDCAWFHVTGKLPEADEGELVFLINCGGEGLVFDKNGEPKQGITCADSWNDAKLGPSVKRVVYPAGLTADGCADFWIDCAANDLNGKMRKGAPMSELFAAKLYPQMRALYYDLSVLISVYDFNADGLTEKEIFGTVLEILKENLDEDKARGLRESLAHVFDKGNADKFHFSAVGHAHLDLAWLWPLRESKRKGARSFASQIFNIGRYPDYVFGASQAQLYQWIKEGYPSLYEKVKSLAKTKNWEVQGATWVEPDSNLIGGESMIRQFYYGKRFFLEEFGQDMKMLFMPDSFGYSACFPQIMRLANVPYFLTQKMSWNTVTKFPHHSFKWRGLDGTEVLAHMLPEDTYNSPVRGDFLKYAKDNFAEKGLSDKALSLYGIGDGGGGPGFEHIERAERFRNLPDMPTVKMRKAIDFFDEIDTEKDKFPVYEGELYLEKHRGTYTTRAEVKRYNRLCETALKNYEALVTLNGGVYQPMSKERLEELWKEVLLYQFHDILPGSSINRVYDECIPRYRAIYGELSAAVKNLAEQVFNGSKLLNLNGFSYNKKLKINEKWHSLSVPAMSAVSPSADTEIKEFFAASGDNYIENDCVKAVFDKGCIVSLFDKKQGREFIPRGKKAGQIYRVCDIGNCWDIRPYNYRITGKNARCLSFVTVHDGAEARAEGTYRCGKTLIKQVFSLTDGSPMLSCEAEIDFFGKNTMLRVAFPVEVQSEVCNFNIQFGHLARKTTENNKTEKAQFEVSGHKFADLSEEGFGISLLNDCKYGFRCKGNVIDMNLLRNPAGGPGKNVDQGTHKVRYAMLPHAGALSGETYKEAYLFNNPLIVLDGEGRQGTEPFFKTSDERIVLESLKPADDGNGIIARIYNSSEEEIEAEIKINGYKAVSMTDIFEKEIRSVKDNILFGRFEVCIVRFCKV